MVASDDEILGSGCRLFDTREDQTYLLRGDSWHSLFPEVSVEDIPQATGINTTSTLHRVGTTNGTAMNTSDHAAANVIIDNYETTPLGTTPAGLASANSLSSTSSESSLEELIEVVTGSSLHSGSRSGTPTSFVATLKIKDAEDVGSNRTGEPDNADLGHATEPLASDATHESGDPSTYPMHNPPLQIMERDEKYDPERIPSSVFIRNDSSKPADWSAASNESLFSIHVGSPSLGGDVPFSPYGDLENSEELTRSGVLLLLSSSSLSTPAETVANENANQGKDFEEKPTAHKDTGKTYPVDQVDKKPPPTAAAGYSSSVSSNSNGSEASRFSFAFPIMKCGKVPFLCCEKKRLCRRKNFARSSCYCSNCSWVFCYRRCKLPRCPSKWSSCFCCRCSWMFCCGWNCSLKRFCCLCTTILAPAAQNGSVKGASEPHLETRNSGVVSKASTAKKPRGCFSCFSCCFSCCSCHRWSCCSCGSCSSFSKCCRCFSCSSCRPRCC